jgi:hypothetical protein
MSWVGFEPTASVFERAKIFHALDSAAIVIGALSGTLLNLSVLMQHIETRTTESVRAWYSADIGDGFLQVDRYDGPKEPNRNITIISETGKE